MIETEHRFTVLENTVDNHARKIDVLEKRIDSHGNEINELHKALIQLPLMKKDIENVVDSTKRIEKSVEETRTDLKKVREDEFKNHYFEPKKEMKEILKTVLMIVITAITGFLIAQLFPML